MGVYGNFRVQNDKKRVGSKIRYPIGDRGELIITGLFGQCYSFPSPYCITNENISFIDGLPGLVGRKSE